MLSCRKNTTGTLNILQSGFAHRRIQFQSSDPVFEAFVHGGGLGIEFEYGYLIDIDPESINPDAVNITVYNCTMYNNTASIGANMFLSVHMPLDNLITVHINKCKFFLRNKQQQGWRIFPLQINSYRVSPYQTGSLTVHFVNSDLYSNFAANGSAIYLGVESECISNDPTMIIIEQCKCYNNLGEHGSGMYVISDLQMNNFRILVEDLVFADNNARFAGGAVYIILYHEKFGDQFGSFGFNLRIHSSEATPFILELHHSKFIH